MLINKAIIQAYENLNGIKSWKKLNPKERSKVLKEVKVFSDISPKGVFLNRKAILDILKTEGLSIFLNLDTEAVCPTI